MPCALRARVHVRRVIIRMQMHSLFAFLNELDVAKWRNIV
jgi:hypothetical protein